MAVRSDSMHHGMPLPFVQPPASLCIVRLSAIGDTCHTVPVVRAIQDAWPSTQLTWIIGKTEHSLLRGLEGVELIVLDKARGLRGYAARPSRARGQAFRRAAAHACVGAREHGEPTRPRAAADRLRPRTRSRSTMAVHEPQAARATRASRHGWVVRVRRADRRQAWQPTLGSADRCRRRRRDRAVFREWQTHPRHQPLHGSTLSQLPQLARGVLRRDRRLRGAALRRPSAR